MPVKYTVKKGDTLNEIAQQHGFSDYKQAGITGFKSGNPDLIYPDEELTIGNKLSTIETGSPIISSTDKEQQFREDSGKLEDFLGRFDNQQPQQTPDLVLHDQNKDQINVNDQGQIETGDQNVDKINSWESDEKKRFEEEAQVRRDNYSSLFNTSLSAIDSTAKATIDRINSTFEKRIAEQRRINNIKVGRVKAYGLGGGAAAYTPIDYTDAVSIREEEAADAIASLEGQRNSLIAQAESARDQGEANLLRQKLEDIDKIDEQLRKQLNDVEAEADAQYKLLKELRAEEEAKHQQEVEEMRRRLVALAPSFISEYSQLSEEEQDQYLEKLAERTGLDYGSVWSIIQNAKQSVISAEQDAFDRNLDIADKNADIDAKKALAEQRRASAYKSYQSVLSDDGENKDFTSAELRKLEQAGLKDSDRQTQLDYLYGDEIEKLDAKEQAGTSLQQRAENAGFDYAGAKKAGYTDEEIEEALKNS